MMFEEGRHYFKDDFYLLQYIDILEELYNLNVVIKDNIYLNESQSDLKEKLVSYPRSRERRDISTR